MIFPAASAEKYSPELLTRAQNGNADAQFWVGYAYYKGEGVTKDVNEAFKWMQKAANQSNASAQNWMGYFYDHGIGTEKNDAKTIEYYTKADNNGNGQAAYYLGMRYFDGNGVERNRIKAFDLFLKSAVKGDNGGRLMLGKCYENGYGTLRDYGASARAYYEGSDKNQNCADAFKALLERLQNTAYTDPLAAEGLAKIYRNGLGVPKDENRAFNYFKIAAEGGQVNSQTALGECYLNGKGTAQNYSEALKWFTKAAVDYGNENAMFYLGLMSVNGYGTSKNPSEGAKWYNRAFDFNINAANNLGFLYENGEGVPKDLYKAIECYTYAANAGDAMSTDNLQNKLQSLLLHQSNDRERAIAGWAYAIAGQSEKGMKLLNKAMKKNEPLAFGLMASIYGGTSTIPQDYNKVREYASQGAADGDPISNYAMGSLYYRGLGVPVDYHKAAEYWSTAAAAGNRDAIYDPAILYIDGKGVEKNPQKALELLNEALDMGSINALAKLAVLSYNGEGVPQDYNRAFKLLKRCTTHRRNITDNV